MKKVVAVWMCLLWTVAACAPADSETLREPTVPEAYRPAPVLLISIDGFRHDYRRRAPTPNLDRLAGDGVMADGLVQGFPTKTFPAHWTLATGLYTENHGVVANRMWDPQRQKWFSLRDREAVEDPAWYDGEPIWRTAERQGLRAATFFWPGSEAPVGGRHASYWERYDARIPHAARIDQVLAWLDLPPAERPDVVTLYFSHVDSVGHRDGPDAETVTRAIARLDRDLGRLLAGLEARALIERMHIVLVSDHGMSTVDPERYIWLEDHLDLDRVRVSDAGPAAQIWATGMAPEAVVAALAGAHPNLRVWRREETPAHYRFRDHPRIADVLAEADHGWMIGIRRQRGLQQLRPPRGMHGWDPLHREMHGIFIAHGPGFRAGARLGHLESVHVHGLIAHLLGIEPAATDGTLAAFAAVLHDPPEGLGPPPEPLPVLHGARHPAVESAEALASAELTVDGRLRTLSGTLRHDCRGASCSFRLHDAERDLHMQGAALDSLQRKAATGQAVVEGRLVAAEGGVGLEVSSLLLLPAPDESPAPAG